MSGGVQYLEGINTPKSYKLVHLTDRLLPH